MAVDSDNSNPYPGPRPFEREEESLFFGRDREKRELRSLLIAHREVLLYAQSGAGKTSLLNSGIIPLLIKEGFEVLPVVRVGGHLPESIASNNVPNVYVMNVLLGWDDSNSETAGLSSSSLAPYLASRPQLKDRQGLPCPRIAIFDQFEELFTTHSEHWKDRRGFFEQVQEALRADPFLRLLFVIREDFVAHLEPYIDLLPEHLRTRYRLERLRPEAALLAVENPLRNTSYSFAEGVAFALVQELLKIRVEDQTGQIVKAAGQYVEPVQLQVVCQNLWSNLQSTDMVITASHLETYGDVDEALKDFYENSIQKTVQLTSVKEGELRKWFATQLITPAGTRGIVYRGQSQTGGISNAAVDSLVNEHIIRAEVRAGSRWYELTHDRFIEPIQKANENWTGRLRVTQFRWRIGAVLILSGILMIISWWLIQNAEEKAQIAKEEALVAQEEAQRARKIESAYESYSQGKKFLLEGEIDNALNAFESASYAFEEFGEERALVNTLIKIGQALAGKDEYDLADEAYTKALEVNRSLAEEQLQGRIFENFASLKESKGESNGALEFYELASKSYRNANDLQNEGRILEHLALLSEKNGNASTAEEKYLKALNSFRAIRDDLGIARIKKALSVSRAFTASNFPWGFLINIHTAEIYELKGEDVDIGRSVPDVSLIADISFPNRFVSRHHLVIRNNYFAEDLRSTNGTTINGSPLYYGSSRKLQDRDVLVLANIKALLFKINRPTAPLAIPSESWGIYINNQSKSYVYLTDQEYSLEIQNGTLTLSPGFSNVAMMKIRKGLKPEVWDVKDQWEVLYTVKVTDYEYKSYSLPQDEKWITLEKLSVPLQYVQLSQDKKTVKKEGPNFQIIQFDEPPCCPN